MLNKLSRKGCKRIENNANFFKEPKIIVKQTADFHSWDNCNGALGNYLFLPFNSDLVIHAVCREWICYERVGNERFCSDYDLL